MQRIRILSLNDSEYSNLASEIMSRLVKNCSDHLLLDLELSVLKKGLSFVVTPHRVPVMEIVTATESGCRSPGSGDAHELKSNAVQLLDRQDMVKDQNVTKIEWVTRLTN